MQKVRENYEGSVFNLRQYLQMMEDTVLREDLCVLDAKDQPHCIIIPNEQSKEETEGATAFSLLEEFLHQRIGRPAKNFNKVEIERIRTIEISPNEKLEKRVGVLEKTQEAAQGAY